MSSSRVSRRRAAGLSLVALIVTLLTSVGVATAAQAADMSKFQPGNIISDAVFFNPNTMGQNEIQNFLDQKGTACSGSMCLKNYETTVPSKAADAYCSGYATGGTETAARIIDRVAKSCTINPQVLLVILQKEQGLVTKTNATEAVYTKAMGFRCTDSAACEPQYAGFGNQVYHAARRFQEYTKNPSFNWIKVGQVNQIRYHPNEACGTAPVHIANQATAGLYYYTPYQPNAAAIQAGAGTGDACSSYGNRNFYRYFTDWFGNPGGPFTDVPPWHTFVSQITWLSQQKITSGYADGSFRPGQPVLREQMAAFLYRFEHDGANPTASGQPSGFTDVSSQHVFKEHIVWLAGSDITTGYADGSFRPGQPVLREQMAAFLYRLAGSPPVTDLPTTSPFKDVSTQHEFYKEIVWMSRTGVTTGYDDGSFRPGQPVLREQMAAFLYRVDQEGL
ncbi:MAG: S-layer homology domain-containing protein [Aeromicrobium sp.]|uniref:S-layer homology domain-containing protein n=1 Tax=Aeromicrobium sp. TaxID=1871063 RepID=UPI0039E5D9C4